MSDDNGKKKKKSKVGWESFSESEDDNSDEDAVISFKTRRFVAKKDVDNPQPKNNDSSDSDDSSDDCSLIFQQPRRGRKKNTQAKKSLSRLTSQKPIFCLDSSSSSSSSDSEDVVPKNRNDNNNNNKMKSHLVTMLDSGSDDDDDETALNSSLLSQESQGSITTRTRSGRYPTRNTLLRSMNGNNNQSRKRSPPPQQDPKTADIMKKAKEAQEKLLLAQNYQADDFDTSIEYDDPPISPPPVATDINSTSTSTSVAAAAAGPMIRISLRTNICSTNTASLLPPFVSLQGNKSVFRLHMNDTFQTLLQNYKHKFSSVIPFNSDIRLSFDGEILQSHQTPQLLDMEEDDLMDVLVTLPNKPQMTMMTTTTQSPSTNIQQESVIITTRIKGGDRNIIHKYQLRKRDAFIKLVQAYRDKHNYSSFKKIQLYYKDQLLDLNSTPDLEDMPKHVDIDIQDESQRANQTTTTTTTTLQNQGIPLKIRQNGKDDTIQTFTIGLTESFETLIQQFLRKNHYQMHQCQFSLDGAPLHLRGTPEDEDLEGDEIIDVQIKLQPSPKQPSIRSNHVPPNKHPKRSTRETTHQQQRQNMIISLSSDDDDDDDDECDDNDDDFYDAQEYHDEGEDDDIIIMSSPPTTTTTTTRNRRKPSQTQARIGNYFSSSAPPQPNTSTASIQNGNDKIIIRTYRNNMTQYRPKTFRFSQNQTVLTLRLQYMGYYQVKGCRSVRFYFNNVLIDDDEKSFADLGISKQATFYAIENDHVFHNTS